MAAQRANTKPESVERGALHNAHLVEWYLSQALADLLSQLSFTDSLSTTVDGDIAAAALLQQH